MVLFEIGSCTVIFTAFDAASLHTPLLTTARNHVSEESAPEVKVLAVLEIEDQGAPPVAEDSHLTMDPT